MRRQYRFDYGEARPNRFVAMFKGQAKAVALDPDVASVFESAESVDQLLRSVISAFAAKVKPRRGSHQAGAGRLTPAAQPERSTDNGA